MFTRRIAAVSFCVGWLVSSPVSSTRAAGQDRLAEAESVTCTFSVIASGTWTDGEAEALVDASTLSLRFEAIDADGATAEVVGPYGPSHLIVRKTGEYLHFVQMFMVGPLYTTTIFDRETRDGNLMAVHTRHEYTDVSLVGFTSRPDQYYGECELDSR